MLEMGQVVVVKRLREVNTPEREFRDKITIVGAMEHPNLVPLRAYYFNRDEKLLVYDYMPMGSLSALLHGTPSILYIISSLCYINMSDLLFTKNFNMAARKPGLGTATTEMGH